MNKNQYFAVSGFILIMMFFIQYVINPAGNSFHHESVYYGVRDGILSVMMWLSFPLMFLFLALAYFEKK